MQAGDGEEIKSEGGPCPNDSSTEDASHRNRKIVSRVSDVIQDVMVAGAHSTSIVFHWAVLLLLLHKEEQDLVSLFLDLHKFENQAFKLHVFLICRFVSESMSIYRVVDKDFEI